MNRQCYIQTSKRSNIDIIQITGRLEAEKESKLSNDISESDQNSIKGVKKPEKLTEPHDYQKTQSSILSKSQPIYNLNVIIVR